MVESLSVLRGAHATASTVIAVLTVAARLDAAFWCRCLPPLAWQGPALAARHSQAMVPQMGIGRISSAEMKQ